MVSMVEAKNSSEVKRLRIFIQGQVQGVGFRPCAYQIAGRLKLTGWIKNNADGVVLEVQGLLAEEFIHSITVNLPPLAKITQVQKADVPIVSNESHFTIIASEPGKANTLIAPDTGICEQCLQELFDPQSRYYRYPFLNCTHCGPRFTITQQLPYDRCHTALAEFPLCQQCLSDYTDPENRRYHAQATACSNCGPQLSLAVEEIAQRIDAGEILAVKGLGGYQLICDATNEAAVLKLRQQKQRDAKPFALMAANSKSAQDLVQINKQEQQLLESASRPIVLLKKKKELTGIAPGLNTFGLMLPYTPVHYLLFHELQTKVIVVTSANIAGEPIIINDDEAEQKLQYIADKTVHFNRCIVARADDSVLRIINGAPVFIRRARGFVPTPIQLPQAIPATIALGGHLKNTFCVTRGDEAFVSQHIGSLNNKASIDFLHESVTHFLKFLAVKPQQIAHDLHPDFYTTHWAQSFSIPAFAIQHHHAHLASVMAEQGIQKPVLGLALDGYGYGNNGQAWGGELMLLDQASAIHLGSLFPLLQPGGDRATYEPWRMAASVLHALGKAKEINRRFSDCNQAQLLPQLLDKKLNCMPTSSCGRLFDAASALLGIQLFSDYEGQAAMLMESLVTDLQVMDNGWRIKDNCLDMLPMFELLTQIKDAQIGANLFHGTFIAGLTQWIKAVCTIRQLDTIVLSGGCFLNQVLAEGLCKALAAVGIKPLLPRQLPANDGGIALGQAWIAGIKG